MFLALVMTWNQLAACEATVSALERLQHAKASQVLPADKKASERAVVAYSKGVRAKDIASLCAVAAIGEDE